MDEEPIIWLYWVNPPEVHEKAPYLQACLKSMFRNSQCMIKIVSDDTISQYVSYIHPGFPYLKPYHQADVFRCNVLFEHGGMYLDFDTVVMRSLVSLFEELRHYDFVGADWNPKHSPNDKWKSSVGVGCMGPCKPNLTFLKHCIERQNAVLDRSLDALLAGERYPIRFTQLLSELVGPAFDEAQPKAKIKDGAKTWFSLVGDENWWGGDLGHAFRRFSDIGELPDSELFTLSNSLMQSHYLHMPIEEILQQETIFGEVFRRALL